MLHPRLTPVDGPQRWLAEVGDFGAWSDLSFIVRFGDGPCGMFEASWSLPLPPGYDDPVLRRGTLVDLMQGPWRAGSSLYVTDVERGDGYGTPWQVTASGLGREVTSGYYALDGGGNTTAVPSVAATAAIGRGWRLNGVDSSVSSVAYGQDPPDAVNSLGDLLNDSSAALGKRWGVGRDNVLRFYDDPIGPEYMTTPRSGGLSTSDDDFATTLFYRYLDKSTGTYETVHAPDSESASDRVFGHKEQVVDKTDVGPMLQSDAQARVDAIYARARGRLSWLSLLTLTPNDLLTIGGGPVDLLKFAEDVGRGTMLRIHGVWSDLLAYTGHTYVDVIVGEVKKADDTDAIDVSPLGLSPTDLAAIVESLTRSAAA